MKKKIGILTGLFTFVIISSIGCANTKQNIETTSVEKQETTITNDLENQSQDDENNDTKIEEPDNFDINKDEENVDNVEADNKKVEKTFEDYPFLAEMSSNEYYDNISDEYIAIDNTNIRLFIGWRFGQTLSFMIEKEDDEILEETLGDITETEIILPFVKKYIIPFNWKTNEYDELIIEYKKNEDGTLELTNNGNTICFEISKDKKLTKEYENLRKEWNASGLCID